MNDSDVSQVLHCILIIASHLFDYSDVQYFQLDAAAKGLANVRTAAHSSLQIPQPLPSVNILVFNGSYFFLLLFDPVVNVLLSQC